LLLHAFLLFQSWCALPSSAACSQNIVVPLPSNTPQEMESNVQRILQWLAAYKSQHGFS
jgi:hypothetical protein